MTVKDSSNQGMGQFDRVMLAHGGGGQVTDELIGGMFLPRLGNDILDELMDSGLTGDGECKTALTIDGYVVQPLVFPGGDIGKLAVCGTVNDLSVAGAQPLGLALGMILAEGLERDVLESVVDSIRVTADEAGVKVITGDTKVVGRTQADQMYLTTAGVGQVPKGRRLHVDRVKSGDKIILNGYIADHGLAVMLARELPDVKSVVKSDVAPLNGLIGAVLERCGESVVFMRDATRGGLAGVAADLAAASGLHVVLEEDAIPVRAETLHAAEMLGLDPLEVANEGKVVTVVRAEAAAEVLKVMKGHEYGSEARIIGEIESMKDGLCEIHTSIGGRRIVQKPFGEQLPRIC